MKRFFKIFIFILVLILSISANVLACEFTEENLGLNKKYNKFLAKKNIEQDVLSEKYYEVNIRGTDICDDLKKAEVTVFITDSEIAGVKINRYDSSDKIIYQMAVSSFGEPANIPNFEKIKGVYADFFDSGNMYSTYKYSKSDDGIDESILIMSKDLMGKIDKNNKTKETDEK